MAVANDSPRTRLNTAAVIRVAVGLIWLAGAACNALVTLRMPDPWG